MPESKDNGNSGPELDNQAVINKNIELHTKIASGSSLTKTRSSFSLAKLVLASKILSPDSDEASTSSSSPPFSASSRSDITTACLASDRCRFAAGPFAASELKASFRCAVVAAVAAAADASARVRLTPPALAPIDPDPLRCAALCDAGDNVLCPACRDTDDDDEETDEDAFRAWADAART
jgi:hypothetical protein